MNPIRHVMPFVLAALMGACVRDTVEPNRAVLVAKQQDWVAPPAQPAAGVQWYVSPTGSRTGNGSSSAPWDLRYALEEGAGNRILPGHTVWLLPGTYTGHFTTTLSGTPTARITFAASGRAILDDSLVGCPDPPAHLHVQGQWLLFRGFEITNTNPSRTSGSSCGGYRPQPVYNHGNNNTYQNLIIHDGGHFFNDATATGLQVTGCIIYNNGWDRPGNADGHGFYLQSNGTSPGSVFISKNVIFNGFAYGIHVYSGGNPINNITLDSNVSFNNSTLSANAASSNLLVGGTVSSQGNVVNGNMTYFSPDTTGILMGPNVKIGFGTTLNSSVAVTNNYFVGRGNSNNAVIDFGFWSSASVNGNSFVGCKSATLCDGRLLVTRQYLPPYAWSNNLHTRDPATGSWTYQPQPPAALVTTDFNGWKAGSHLGGTDQVAGGPPTTNKVVVLVTNTGDRWARSALIVVYNWENLPTVHVSLPPGLLCAASSVHIHNVQDLYGADVGFTYQEGSVDIQVVDVTPPIPIGSVPHQAPHTGTTFNVYLLQATVLYLC